jgi:hypothetical protein
VEGHETKRGLIRTDLTAFFSRHLPAMATLSQGEIYVGIPGRRGDMAPQADNSATVTTEPVGRCMVAGVNVYDAGTAAKVGGVVVECDLERVLRNHLQTASPRVRDVVLADSEGNAMMHFARGHGLQPANQGKLFLPDAATLNRLFKNVEPHDVLSTAPNVCLAKVSLDPYRPERWMGLIVFFDP